MLNVLDELKILYRTDTIPQSEVNAYKQLILYFPELDLTITNNQIVGEDFSLTESICSDTNLTFGGCEASSVEIKVADVTQDITGKKMIVTQIVNGIYEVPLGTFKVDSAKKTNDLRYKQIIAYDYSKYALEKDVAEWYKGLAFPMTLKSFRESFFNHIGLEIESQTLINDDLSLSKTIEPTTLKALDVAVKIGELNGVFGKITRLGKFKYITITNDGLYPSEELYPSNDLYPFETGEYLGSNGYISVDYEEYMVQPVDCLQIRQQEGDVGSVVFDNAGYKNPYIITGNFLVYGKSASQLDVINRRIFNQIKNITYRPNITVLLGRPYLETGDLVVTLKNTDTIESYAFTRTLRGVQALRDTIGASGSEYRDNKVSPNTEIEMLKGKSLVIEKSVDGLNITVSDLEVGMTEIGITAQEISTKVSDLQGNYSAISQSVGMISTTVSNLDGDFSILEQTVNGFTFKNASGQTRISGSTISTGILESVSVIFSKTNTVFFSAGGSSLTGSGYEWRLDSNAFYSAEKSIELNRLNGNIMCYDIYMKDGFWEGWSLTETMDNVYARLRALEGA